ncbi:Dedicator of cytokinesis protein 4 [Thelotrema lepadinum]|nr:Dedicator of cytokinesis protein 4 [Thelotrema lepadinum]
MPWRPLPRIAFAIAVYPFEASSPVDLPLELGDELYIIEEGGKDWSWCRGYLVAPPSILAGLTSVRGQTLEARVFSGIFPRACVEIREMMDHSGTQMEVEESGHINGDSTETHKSFDSDAINGSHHLDEAAEDADEELTTDDDAPAGRPLKSNGLKKTKAPQVTTTEIKAEGSDQDSPAPEKLAPPVPLLKIGDETPSLLSEPLVDEIASCLREWQSTKLHELLLSRNHTHLDKLGRVVQRVDLCRRQLLHGVLSEEEAEILRENTVWDLVNGNKLVGDEVIVRDPKQRGRLLTGSDNPIEVAKLQSSMSLLEKPPLQPQDRVNLHHVLFELRDVACHTTEKTTIIAYICSKKPEEPTKLLSEPFQFELPSLESSSQKALAKARTLFADFSSQDIGESSGANPQVYLVIKVQSLKVYQAKPLTPSQSTPVSEASAQSDPNQDKRTQSLKGRKSMMWNANRLMGSPRYQRQNHAGPAASNQHTQSGPDRAANHQTSNPAASQPSPATQEPYFLNKDIGMAVLNLTKKFFVNNGEAEEILTVWAPSDSVQGSSDQPAHPDLLNDHCPSMSGNYEVCKALDQVKVRLHSFIDPDADNLMRTRPTVLQHVIKSPKIGFSGAPTKPRSDIYLTFTKPSFPGQALFSHPEKGAVPIPGISGMQNIQLLLEVRRTSTGERVNRCIFPSSNSAGTSAWKSASISRGGSWAQTIRLAIPSDDVPDCHLIMSLANSPPDFPFAICWMPLWKNGAFIQDGNHMLLLHEYNKIVASAVDGRGVYLDLAWDSKAKDAINRESWSAHMSCLQLDSFLCSTNFSQDQVLLGLLRWKDYSDDQLLLLLRQVVFVPEIEIVKLVSDTLDALFSILVDRSGNDEFEDLIFNALVTVLSIVHDRRFHLDPLVNEYADLRFNYPFATPCLIRSYLRLITRRADYQNSRQLRATLKVGRQVIKFILVARQQQRAKEAGIGIKNNEAVFIQDFKKMFESLEDQMRDGSPSLIGSKTLIVQHLHTWLPELLPCFSQEDILKIGVSFVDACSHVTGKLVLHKLVLIWNFAKLSHSVEDGLRRKLEARIQEWIAPYWGFVEDPDEQYREQVRLCCSIVALRDGEYGNQTAQYYVKIIDSYHCIRGMDRPKPGQFSLLFPSTYPFPTRATDSPRNYDEALIELSALKATITGDDLMKHIAPGPDDKISLLRKALEINVSIMREEAFPKSWLTLYVYHHRIIFDLLNTAARYMIDEHLPAPEEADRFDTNSWKALLLALLELVRSESLALEILPEQKRRAIWKIVGDIRQHGAELLGKIWDSMGWETDQEERKLYNLDRLGGFQVQYVPSLVPPILELCLSVHEGLRGCSVEVLQSMILSEWSLNEDLGVLQTEMIKALDELFKTRNIGESAQNRFFIGQMLGLFIPSSRNRDNQFWEATRSVMRVIDDLLDLLMAVHAPDQHESLRIINTLKLMEFLRDMQKIDIFIGYVHQLASVEAKASNFREAGLALGLHAELYEWDLHQTVEELKDPAHPEQTAFERKENLYFEMIKHFEEGGAWGPALTCYRELAVQYESTSFDFAKLARTQRSTARIYESIAKGEGETSRYFHVVFRGLGFPTPLRGKEFVYETSGSDRLMTFTDRLQQQHPAAKIGSRADFDNDEVQYLQVFPVNLHKEFDHAVYQRSRVPLSTKEFLLSSKPNKFSITTRRNSAKTGVEDQWVEKTVYTTAETFPTILRRSEITSEETVDLTPLETAIERTVRKNFELTILQKRIRDGDKASINSLIDAIKSSVEPTSNVSVAQYRTVLMKHAAEDDPNAGSQSLVNALQTSLVDFATTLKHCLADLSRTKHHYEHRNLSILFQSTFAPELALLNQISQVPALTSSAPDPELVLPPSNLNLPGDLANTIDDPSTPRAAEPPPIASSRHFLEAGRGRLNSLLRRSVTDFDATNQFSSQSHFQNHSQSQLNGDSLTAPPSRARPSGSDDPSRASSRASGQTNPRNRLSWRTSEDAVPKSSHSRSRKESDPTRPMTAKSGTQASVKTVGSGSIRKRLSTIGLGIGRKGSKRHMREATRGQGVLEEE